MINIFILQMFFLLPMAENLLYKEQVKNFIISRHTNLIGDTRHVTLVKGDCTIHNKVGQPCNEFEERDIENMFFIQWPVDKLRKMVYFKT